MDEHIFEMRIIATVVTDVLVLVSCHCDNAADIYGLLWDWKPLRIHFNS